MLFDDGDVDAMVEQLAGRLFPSVVGVNVRPLVRACDHNNSRKPCQRKQIGASTCTKTQSQKLAEAIVNQGCANMRSRTGRGNFPEAFAEAMNYKRVGNQGCI